MAAGPAPGLAGWEPLRLAEEREGEASTRWKRRGARRSGAETRGKGRRLLSVEVRDSPSLPLGFIDLREPHSPNRARRAH
jgi:hypothetical protein